MCLFISVAFSLSPSAFDISQVLAGEEADITPGMLNTEDTDTPAEEVVYHVDVPTNGILALKESPEESIQNFTQAHINRGEVIFIHKGEGTRLNVKKLKTFTLERATSFSVFCRPLLDSRDVKTSHVKLLLRIHSPQGQSGDCSVALIQITMKIFETIMPWLLTTSIVQTVSWTEDAALHAPIPLILFFKCIFSI